MKAAETSGFFIAKQIPRAMHVEIDVLLIKKQKLYHIQVTDANIIS